MEVKDYVPTLEEEDDEISTTNESHSIETSEVREDEDEENLSKDKGKKEGKITGQAAKMQANKIVSYPTQIMKIGEVKCLFLSCYYQGRTPILSLGPSWPFTLFLIFFGLFITGFFVFMISLMQSQYSWKVYMMASMLVINWLFLFAGIL